MHVIIAKWQKTHEIWEHCNEKLKRNLPTKIFSRSFKHAKCVVTLTSDLTVLLHLLRKIKLKNIMSVCVVTLYLITSSNNCFFFILTTLPCLCIHSRAIFTDNSFILTMFGFQELLYLVNWNLGIFRSKMRAKFLQEWTNDSKVWVQFIITHRSLHFPPNNYHSNLRIHQWTAIFYFHVSGCSQTPRVTSRDNYSEACLQLKSDEFIKLYTYLTYTLLLLKTLSNLSALKIITTNYNFHGICLILASSPCYCFLGKAFGRNDDLYKHTGVQDKD